MKLWTSCTKLSFACYLLVLCSFATLLFDLAQCQARLGSTVIGVDFGAQYIKMSYVAPGEDDPLPIVLNDMSERKTANAVAYRNGKVFFGPHALKPILNQPERGYLWLNTMLGLSFRDQTVSEHLSYTIAELFPDPERGTVMAKTVGEELAPIEYLSANLLSKMVEQAEIYSKKAIRDLVITVPPFYGQAQRRAILDTAKIAGLNVLSLSNDISLAALYYGTFSMSKVTEPRNVVIIDSGAVHTSAALVLIDPQHKEKGKTVTLIEVKKTITDKVVHGLAVDRAVARVLSEKFSEANSGKSVPKGKSYNRLITEASRVKQVLTINTETRAHVEELVEDINLSTKITRDELEAACSDLRFRSSSLIEKLLGEASVSLDSIFGIIPIGGNSRVPFIQADLKVKFGEKVQYVLNMDETVAQGAAWYAAILSRYRVKPTLYRDSYPYAVSLRYTNQNGTPTLSSAPSSIIPVYPAHSNLDGHKGIAFKSMESIDCVVSEDPQGDLFELSISGTSEALAKFNDTRVTSSKLKFWVDLNSSGIIELKDQPVALVEFEVQEPKPQAQLPNTNTSENAQASPQNDASKQSPVTEFETVQKTEMVPLKYTHKTLHSQMPQVAIKSWASE